MHFIIFNVFVKLVNDGPTSERQTDIIRYRAAIAAKTMKLSSSKKKMKVVFHFKTLKVVFNFQKKF
jgi:hypothetical protein